MAMGMGMEARVGRIVGGICLRMEREYMRLVSDRWAVGRGKEIEIPRFDESIRELIIGRVTNATLIDNAWEFPYQCKLFVLVLFQFKDLI